MTDKEEFMSAITNDWKRHRRKSEKKSGFESNQKKIGHQVSLTSNM